MSCYVPTAVADTSPGGYRVTLAIDLDVFNVGSTPLQMLLTVIILTLIVGLVIVVITQIFSPYLNRRWPATAPLSPTELLWGEAGGHVKRTFRGLDLEEQKDLASQLNERKVPAGTAITSQGDAATAFYLLKSGSAEAVQTEPGGGERKLREYAEGDSFGEVAILERSPRTATVRALTDCVVLELPAEDFVAAAAQTAAEGNDFTAVARQFLATDRARARIAVGRAGAEPGAADAAGSAGWAACGSARGWQRHRVVRGRGRCCGRRGRRVAIRRASGCAARRPAAARCRAARGGSAHRTARRAARRARDACGRRSRGRHGRASGAATGAGESRAARDPRAPERSARVASDPSRRWFGRARPTLCGPERRGDSDVAARHTRATHRALR